MIVTDTTPIREQLPANVKQLSVAPLLADVIEGIPQGRSVSEALMQ